MFIDYNMFPLGNTAKKFQVNNWSKIARHGMGGQGFEIDSEKIFFKYRKTIYWKLR